MYARNLPPELLYEVVGLSLAQYLDDLIAGSLKSNPSSPSLELGHRDGEGGADAALRPLEPSVSTNSLEAECYNPVVSLLNSSFQIRHVTLRVLSDALGISLKSAGLGHLETKPLALIQPIRLTYSAATTSKIYEDSSNPSDRKADQKLPNSSPLLLAYKKMSTLEQQCNLVLSHLHTIKRLEDDCAPFETSLYTLAEQMEDALTWPSKVTHGVLRGPLSRRLAGVLISSHHHLLFKVFLKGIELEIVGFDQSASSTSFNYADLLEALQELHDLPNVLEEAYGEWSGLLGPPVDERPFKESEMQSACSILTKVIDLKHAVPDADDANSEYNQCKELAKKIREAFTSLRAHDSDMAAIDCEVDSASDNAEVS